MSKKTPQTATKSEEVRPKKPKFAEIGRKGRKLSLNLRKHEAPRASKRCPARQRTRSCLQAASIERRD